ncbi:hypothetical protein [Rothia sp. P4278]|uniref:hypothetical protein n=1 Tax=Rothia sp. P4278 TaxID=3402658 RepID=UPI003AEAEECD
MTSYPNHQVYTKSPQQVEADKAAQTSTILGIAGLIIFGFILGPLAIWQAKKAESLGSAATIGKVTGWIALIYNVLGFIALVGLVLLAMTASSSTGY